MAGDELVRRITDEAEPVRLNLEDPSTCSLSYFNGDVRVQTTSGSFGLDEILSVFLRRTPNFESFKKTIDAQYIKFDDFIAQQQFFLFSDCLAILDFSKRFVNPLASTSRAGKAVQAKAAASVGLTTPATYMGANSVNASSFAKQILNANKQVCSKPITNTKVLIEGEEHVRFTELLAPDAIHSLESLETCPVIFQEYIPKSYEIRVTVIGEQIFAARIDSQAGGGATSIDWRRYDIPKTPHSAYELPRVVRDQILALHRQLSLIYSSFDFVRTPCGEYVFLETNPFGQWLWIEDLTGLPISKAIADFLAAPSK